MDRKVLCLKTNRRPGCHGLPSKGKLHEIVHICRTSRCKPVALVGWKTKSLTVPIEILREWTCSFNFVSKFNSVQPPKNALFIIKASTIPFGTFDDQQFFQIVLKRSKQRTNDTCEIRLNFFLLPPIFSQDLPRNRYYSCQIHGICD